VEQGGWFTTSENARKVLPAYTELSSQEVIDRTCIRFELNKIKENKFMGYGMGFLINARAFGYGDNYRFPQKQGVNQSTNENYSNPGPMMARFRTGLGVSYNLVKQWNDHIMTRASMIVIGEGFKVKCLLVNPELATTISFGDFCINFRLDYNLNYLSGIQYENYAVAPSSTATASSFRALVGIGFAFD
jgi:hypothetical protein